MKLISTTVFILAGLILTGCQPKSAKISEKSYSSYDDVYYDPTLSGQGDTGGQNQNNGDVAQDPPPPTNNSTVTVEDYEFTFTPINPLIVQDQIVGFTITNTGKKPLFGTFMVTVEEPFDLEPVGTSTCSQFLIPGASCNIFAKFSNSSPRDTLDITLTLNDDVETQIQTSRSYYESPQDVPGYTSPIVLDFDEEQSNSPFYGGELWLSKHSVKECYNTVQRGSFGKPVNRVDSEENYIFTLCQFPGEGQSKPKSYKNTKDPLRGGEPNAQRDLCPAGWNFLGVEIEAAEVDHVKENGLIEVIVVDDEQGKRVCTERGTTGQCLNEITVYGLARHVNCY